METDGHGDSLREQLHEIKRGEAASWVVYPPTPLWWPVTFGLWAATLTLVVGLLDGAVQSITQLVLILAISLMMAWDRRRRGTYPSGRPPRDFHRAILLMVFGAAAVAGVAWVAAELLSVWAAAAVAGVGACAVVSWYEHEYAAIAARIRDGLT
ncbi:MAG: hypothetical protein ACJ72A_17895 [Nocardioidaceae bacterium]